MAMVDYFELLGVGRDCFDADELEERYMEMQARHHPDCGGNAEYSALLSQGYRVLSDEVSRAEHILELVGAGEAKLSREFMMEIMEMSDVSTHLLEARMEAQRHEMRSFFAKYDYQCAALALAKLKSLGRLLEARK